MGIYMTYAVSDRAAPKKPSSYLKPPVKKAALGYGTLPEVRIQNPSASSILIINHPEASNAGGVAVSGLEMAQNSQRLAWASTEVDSHLKAIMAQCYDVSAPLQLQSARSTI
jgi:hypothetical protein